MHRVHRVADAVAAFLGCWALYAWAAVYLGSDFQQLLLGLPLPVTAAGVLFWWARPPRAARRETPAAPIPAGLAFATLAVAVAALFGWWWGIVALPAAAALAVLHLGTLLPASRTGALPALEPTRADLVAVGVAAAAAILATLVANRPDIDDAYYFSAIVGTLAHPGLPLLSFDAMHGEPGVPIHNLIHRPQTFELLTAIVARIPGIDAAHAYYVVLPIVFAALTAFASWLVLARITQRSAAGPAVLLLVFLLLAWGDGHRTWGNYAFVRLYQGKAVFLCALAPLAVHQAFAFCRQATAVRWLLLACATAAAASVTSSGLAIAPAAVGLALLGAAPLTRSGLRRAFVGLAAATPPLFVLLLAQRELSAAALSISDDKLLALDAVVGNGVRGPLVLSLALGLPLLLHLARSAAAAGTTRWIGATFLLVLNGVSAPLLGNFVAPILSWRLYWAALVPILAAGSLGVSVHVLWDTVPRLRPHGRDPGPAESESPRPPGAAVALATLALAAGIAHFAFGRWTLDPKNGVSLHFASPKRPEAIWALAREVVERAPPGSSVLAPTPVASWLTAFEGGPQLVAVRSSYTNDLRRFWGDDESAIRQDLQDFAEGSASAVQIARAYGAIDQRCIGVIVTSSRARKQPLVREVLRSLGFTREKRRRYDLWTREPPLPGCGNVPKTRARHR